MESSPWYVIKQRLAWIKMHERGAPVTGVCQHYGISRKTFYKWWRRYQEAGRDFHILQDLSRRPHSHPRAVPRATAERVLCACWFYANLYRRGYGESGPHAGISPG